MKIDILPINEVEKILNTDLEVIITIHAFEMKCGDGKCRLLSHLLHKAGLEEVHCNKNGEFRINLNEYNLNEILNAFNDIVYHPEWIVGFVEKYVDNEFMIQSTFKKEDVGEEEQ